jgi:protoheme IX farnesyltransferase
MVLKRRTTQNIVWGGLAGCFPTLIGWTAVTNELAWPPVVLFLVAFYLFGYTMVLKRRTTQNIVWGGLAGCFPTLIGWTAVTNELAWPPVVLFLVVFFWTPPHTWALAMRYREDYARVDVPMLPVVKDAEGVARQIVAYSWVMVAVSLALWPVADTGILYPVVASVLGAGFLVEAHLMWHRARRSNELTDVRPMRLFHWSNMYLSLLFVAVALDPLIHGPFAQG